MYDISALYEAVSLENAIQLMQQYPEAVIIAGGSDVLIKIREGKLRGCSLISLQKLNELRGVTLDEDESLRILPLTSFSHIAKNPLIQKHMGVLAMAVDMVGGPQIRNIGTIGGNVCNGVTSADSASTLMAYDAVLEITGAKGTRQASIKDFYIKAGQVALEKGELLTAILIKKESYHNTYGHYIKYAMRNAMDIATLGCSVNVRLSADKKTIERMRAGYGVAGPVPMRAASAENKAAGKPVSIDTVKTCAREALLDVSPRTSWRASKEFRLQLVEELLNRAMIQAIKDAGGRL